MKVSVTYTIDRNLPTVYQAIIDKNKLNKYFVSFSSHNLDKAEKIHWKWEDYNAECEISNVNVIENQSISFDWGENGDEKQVFILLEELPDNKTKIKITEGPFNAETDIAKMLGQNQGWTDFACCLKAYLYAGINLRK